MKTFLDFAKDRENDELKRQIDHHAEMAEKHQEKAEAALMMGDRDGHALHMAKSNHFKTQGENLKGIKEEVEQIDELMYTTSSVKSSAKPRTNNSSQVANNLEKSKMSDYFAKRRAENEKNKPTSEEVKEVKEGLGRFVSRMINKTAKSNKTPLSQKTDRREFETPGTPSKPPVKEDIEQIDEAQTELKMKPSGGADVMHPSSSKPIASITPKMDKFGGKHRATFWGHTGGTDQTKDFDSHEAAHSWVRNRQAAKTSGERSLAKAVKSEEVQQVDEATPAWQRKEGKSASGGLNRKGIASYRKANPGSKLSMAVTTKPSKLKPGSKAANRRKSFCARMSGMKKRLTSAKTANDPDSRINKSLRKWNC